MHRACEEDWKGANHNLAGLVNTLGGKVLMSRLAFAARRVDGNCTHPKKMSISEREPSKRRRQNHILGVSLVILLMPNAYAVELPGDSAEGKRLHDANCMHNTGIYTRKDRLIQSLDALKERLSDCSHMANKEFSAIETQNIIKYLNDQFYQFR